jgi:hypothetical protein
MTAAVVPAIRRGPVLAIILASYLMIVLDISIVIRSRVRACAPAGASRCT